MKQRSIAFTIYNLSSGGAERVLTTLANELVDNYNIVIITLVDCTSFYTLNSKIKLENCGLHEESNGFASNAMAYYRTVSNLKKHIKNHNIDLVISFTTTVNIFSILAASSTKTKCIISERNNPYLRVPNTFWKLLRNNLYKQSDLLIVQTEASANYFAKLVEQSKIKIVANPLARELTEKRILPRNRTTSKTILNVGRLDKNKSQDLLIKAFANIDHKNWKVELIGDGSELKNYQQLAKDLKIEEKIIFKGKQTNIWEFYNQATIFAFTSKSEGFPNALTEAMYFGVPSISTNCPSGPSELITDNENGFLVEVGDQITYEKKLAQLMQNLELQDTFSKNSIITSTKYETENIVVQWKIEIEKTLSI